MLYKVTPMMVPAQKAKGAGDEEKGRKKRKSAVYDHEGHEVLISLMCLKCRQIKPLAQFGLRKMADGAIRNQPWCRTCRAGAGTPKAKPGTEAPAVATPAPAPLAAEASVVAEPVETAAPPAAEAPPPAVPAEL